MSYIINTRWVAFSPRQNHSGSVPITVCGMPTVFASEDSFTEWEPFGFHGSALSAGHRGVSGRNEDDCPTGSLCSFDQFTLNHADRSISCRSRKPLVLGHELWFQVFDSDDTVMDHDSFSPDARRVLTLSGTFSIGFRRLPLRSLVTRCLWLSLRISASRHLSLSMRHGLVILTSRARVW